MNKKILEIIVAANMLVGITAFTSNNIYAQEHKTINQTEQKNEYFISKAEQDTIREKFPNSIRYYDTNPAIKKSVMPEYPEAMIKQKAQGKIYLQICLDKYGKIGFNKKKGKLSVDILKSSGFTELDDLAIEAAKKYEFSPAIDKDKAVGSIIIIPIEYKLKK